MRKKPLLTKFEYVLLIVLIIFMIVNVLLMLNKIHFPSGIDTILYGFNFLIIGTLFYRSGKKKTSYFIWGVSGIEVIAGCIQLIF